MLLGVFRKHGIALTRRKDDEYFGACPACNEGHDRCTIWPYPDAGKKRGPLGRYYCRRCAAHGDAINFLMEFENMSYTQACDYLRVTPEANGVAAPTPAGNRQFSRHTSGTPTEKWQAQAMKLVDEAHAALLEHPEQLGWLEKRGISISAVRRFRLGFVAGEKDQPQRWRPRSSWGLPNLPGKDGKEYKVLRIPRGLLIPYSVDSQILRLNIRRPDTDWKTEAKGSKYHFIPGGNMQPMMIEAPADVLAENRRTPAWIVVESELDAIMLASQLEQSGLPVGFIGLRTARVSNLEERVFAALKNSASILVALDFDQAGRQAWETWPTTFAQAKRWPVPVGKDPGEAFAAGRSMAEWIRVGLPPVLTLKAPASVVISKEASMGKTFDVPSHTTPARNKPGAGQKPEVIRLADCYSLDEGRALISKLLESRRVAQAWLQPRLAELLSKGWTEAGLFAQGSDGWPFGGWGIAWSFLWLTDAQRNVLSNGSIIHTFYDEKCRINNHIRTVTQKPNCGI